MEEVFNPWDVSGKFDYDELVKKFGIKKIEHIPKFLENNILFKRGKVFAHRDFNIIVDAIENKKEFCMMTGLMPTGCFHIGHMILAQQIIFYQSLGAKIYIAVADVEAYHARGQSLEDSKRITIDQYIKNYIALGLKPTNCEIYFQSDRSKDSKKSNAYYRLQNLLSGHATFNEFKAVYGEITPGKMLASLLQGADMLHPQLPEFEGKIPLVIPVGIDQDPHIRLTRDIAKRMKLNSISSTYHVFVPGLGGGKMSSSDPTSFIALTDDAKTVDKKIKKYAFSGGRDTLQEHRTLGGIPEIDVSYQWLTFFEEDDKIIADIYSNYKSGKLLSGELKEILIKKMNSILGEIQNKRKSIDSNKLKEFGIE